MLDFPRTILSDAMYAFLKWIVQIVLPAFGALYFGLGDLWGFPNTSEVVGSTAILATFLGLVLGLSAKNYNQTVDQHAGDIVITDKDSGGQLFSLELDGDPAELAELSKVTFKIKNAPVG